MLPNTFEVPIGSDPDIVVNEDKPRSIPAPPAPKNSYGLQICLSLMIVTTRILMVAIVVISFIFSFRNGLPIGPTNMHIILCIVGYQLLMAEGILYLRPETSWSTKYTQVQKRRAHWILQILGSTLAIAGSIVKILDKDIHWDTLHGQFALVAMVFTGLSFINGLTSLYADELSKFIPSNLSTLSHILIGVVAFMTASVSLIYGFDKEIFRNWYTTEVTDTVIAFTVIFTFLIIINPLVTFYLKTKAMVKRD